MHCVFNDFLQATHQTKDVGFESKDVGFESKDVGFELPPPQALNNKTNVLFDAHTVEKDIHFAIKCKNLFACIDNFSMFLADAEKVL